MNKKNIKLAIKFLENRKNYNEHILIYSMEFDTMNILQHYTYDEVVDFRKWAIDFFGISYREVEYLFKETYIHDLCNRDYHKYRMEYLLHNGYSPNLFMTHNIWNDGYFIPTNMEL